MSDNIAEKQRTAIVVAHQADTVAELAHLACELLQSDNCAVIVLSVSLGAVEAEDEAFAAIEARVQQLIEDEELPLRSLTASSTSEARGVLDTAREEGVDLIVVSAEESEDGIRRIGSVAENIAAAAPCRVVIYRRGETKDIHRIVIAVSAHDLFGEAITVGVHLAQQRAQAAMILVISKDAFGGAARRQLRDQLTERKIDSEIPIEYISNADPIAAIFAKLDKQDLLILGYSGNGEQENHWFYSQGSATLLARADGAVALVRPPRSRLQAKRSNSAFARAITWLRPVLTPAEQRELVARADQMAAPSLDYLVLTLIAALLASFGLLANSNAVIIGAMLVAPLIAPLVAFAVSGVTGRVHSIGRAANALFQGFGVAVLVAVLVGYLSRSQIITPEMASRGNPTLVDMGVALASGMIAAYANARKDIPAALAGVAIAAALMPPICTVGLSLAMGNLAVFRGALQLFAVNISSIVIAAWATFFYLGMRPRSTDEVRRRPLAAGLLLSFFGIVLALVVTLALTPISSAQVERQLRDAFVDSELVSVDVRRSEPLEVIAIIRRDADQPLSDTDVMIVERNLAAAISQSVRLQVVVYPTYGVDAFEE